MSEVIQFSFEGGKLRGEAAAARQEAPNAKKLQKKLKRVSKAFKTRVKRVQIGFTARPKLVQNAHKNVHKTSSIRV